MNKKNQNIGNGRKNSYSSENQSQENQPQELSYFRLSLLAFLRESHPELADDTDFIASRGDSAAEAYSETVRSGLSHDVAAEVANEVLFANLHFSKYDTIVTVLWNEFEDEILQGIAKTLGLQLLSVCEEVFAKYPLSDDFAFDPQFDSLYTELTGTILIWLDEHGV